MELSELRTVVNVPPTMIKLPTWVIVTTSPSITCGVKLSGLSLTIRNGCGSLLPVSAAMTGGPPVRPPIAAAKASTNKATTDLRTFYPVFHNPGPDKDC